MARVFATITATIAGSIGVYSALVRPYSMPGAVIVHRVFLNHILSGMCRQLQLGLDRNSRSHLAP